MPGSTNGNEAIFDELMELAREPGRHLLQFQSRAAAHQYLGLYRLFRRHVPAGAAVLDWGAGNGHFSYFLTRAGYRATGFSLEDLDYTKWFQPESYRAVLGDPSDPVRLPFESGSFDAVASVGVLEHVRETGGNEAASLAEIVRVLRPGGSFVCYHFPNRYSAIEFVAGRISGKHHHRFRYTAAEVRTLVRGAGLELVEMARYGILPRNVLNQLPRALRETHGVARVWDALDNGLRPLFSPLAQNYLFVARRPDPSHPSAPIARRERSS